ncbi:MAG: hypothetical protein NTX57_09590 [Armatimonadetes bacterium]|nr:hypothetical protein [Armatimonadota bacterium]
MNSGEVTEPVAPEMSFEEFVAWCEANPYHDENGIDLSHLRENLKLTPRERVEKLQRAVAMVVKIRPLNSRQKS